MSIFKTEQPAPPPQPETVVHHHPAPNPAAAIFTAGMMAVIGIIAAWKIGVYLLAEAGALYPHKTLATAILWLVGAGIVFAMLWLLSSSLFGQWLAHRETMADKQAELERIKIEVAQYQARMAASRATDARLMEPQKRRLHALIETIMVDAYHHGDKKWERARPWARSQAEAVILPNETTPVGYTLANNAKRWLVDNGVLVGRSGRESVDFHRYPNLASVQRRLADIPVWETR